MRGQEVVGCVCARDDTPIHPRTRALVSSCPWSWWRRSVVFCRVERPLTAQACGFLALPSSSSTHSHQLVSKLDAGELPQKTLGWVFPLLSMYLSLTRRGWSRLCCNPVVEKASQVMWCKVTRVFYHRSVSPPTSQLERGSPASYSAWTWIIFQYFSAECRYYEWTLIFCRPTEQKFFWRVEATSNE